MPTPNEIAPPRHLGYLDSARGIAALMVLFAHFTMWKYGDLTIMKSLGFVFNADDAVCFFFVLSGMVLTYQYVVSGNSLDIRKYAVNRFMRLFPGFFLIVLVNTLYVHRHILTGHGLYEIFVQNKHEFWEEAILIKSHVRYFTPGWTLTIELAGSFFIPFLIALGKVNRKLLGWLIIASFVVHRITDMFIFHFTMGALISFYFYELSSDDLKQKRWYKFRYLILLAAIVLFSLRKIHAFLPAGSTFMYIGKYLQLDVAQFSALSSCIFIVWMIRSKGLQRFLSFRPLIFLGKISYGVYLIHWLIVVIIYDHWNQILAHFPNQKTAFIVMMAACFFSTILLATILHYAVELPFIRLGKRFTARLKPSLVV